MPALLCCRQWPWALMPPTPPFVHNPGFLLEIATVMAACGAEVHQAIIQGAGGGEVWEVWGQVGGVDMQQVYLSTSGLPG